ncbi:MULTISPECIES: hypothetical protein [Idiomarina]|uniref:hypothetical protein n=1 Tax=Idiomarina TaxID=135575 RepID=UPI00129C3B1F|nr:MULTISPECIES: hypothetical protein [Idiomarina]MRJ43238.1 hypothetical protein [Idiomarina sp. FeN1]NCU58754.1 hypothetical protein [Idiomarina sp. FenA--70]NCU61450.1 hypothetical protein [Idiomarina sp. FenBw--71]UUN12685.1 hypothetical protein KGF88_08450 [Idiomarina loihiensis]
MNPDIFITDFERTDNTDELHAILGRALIIATRFDSMCEAAAIGLELKKDALSTSRMTEPQYNDYLQKLSSEYRTLNGNIKSIGLPDDISVVLHDARKARNTVAHDLSKGLEGCLDTKIDELDFIRQVSELVMDIAYGDIAISYTLSLFNGDPCPNLQYISSYKDRIVQWVVER